MMKRLMILLSIAILLSACNEEECKALRADLASQKADLVSVKADLLFEKSNTASLREEVRQMKSELNKFSKQASELKEANLLAAEKVRQQEQKRLAFGTVTIQAGLTMKNGKSEPLTNCKIFICKKPFSVLTKDTGVMHFKYNEKWVKRRSISKEQVVAGLDRADYWISGVMFQSLEQCAYNYRVLTEAVQQHASAVVITSFIGDAELKLKSGDYYFTTVSSLGGGVLWSVPVTVTGGESVRIVLNNDNVLKSSVNL
ncbi:MAG: hypothetical protein HRT88_11795 [Lentisphaeraceae bacterium]|nr:hypothetical protein [Lentisphaeraceae bacterium]